MIGFEGDMDCADARLVSDGGAAQDPGSPPS